MAHGDCSGWRRTTRKRHGEGELPFFVLFSVVWVCDRVQEGLVRVRPPNYVPVPRVSGAVFGTRGEAEVWSPGKGVGVHASAARGVPGPGSVGSWALLVPAAAAQLRNPGSSSPAGSRVSRIGTPDLLLCPPPPAPVFEISSVAAEVPFFKTADDRQTASLTWYSQCTVFCAGGRRRSLFFLNWIGE